jgi:hypothetical protein
VSCNQSAVLTSASERACKIAAALAVDPSRKPRRRGTLRAGTEMKNIDPWIMRFDACTIGLSLAAALMLPIAFMVPYNDEWLRMNYLADHSVWEWTVMHTVTWVVRPTAELIMAFISARTSRPALGAHPDAAHFLTRFHALYLVLAGALLGLVGVLARLLGRGRHTLALWGTLCALLWLCIWSSDELGYAFYWADGYANVVLPFMLLLAGMTALCAERWPVRAVGALGLVLSALSHEVLCMYALGFVLLRAAWLPQPRGERWLLALLALGLFALLYAQGFSAGPSLRSAVFAQKSGAAYNWAGAWRGIQHIDPWRSLFAFCGTLALLAIQRPWLELPLLRARAHAREHPLFWSLLALGALATCLLPLASVGLKKPRVAVAAYSVMTELFVILAAVLAYPLLDPLLERAFRAYRRTLRSALPLLLLAAYISPNLADYRSVLSERHRLRGQARAYMESLFAGRDARVRLERPCHRFVKVASTMTTRNAKQYFALRRFEERDCPH